MEKKITRKPKKDSFFIKCVIVFLFASISFVAVISFFYNNTSVSTAANAEDSNNIADEETLNEDTNTIYKNIYINDINVGELTKEQALEKINNQFQPELENKTITFIYGEESSFFKFAEFNAKYDFSQAVEEAYQYGRVGSSNERNNETNKLNTSPHRITYEPRYNFDDNVISAKIQPIVENIYVTPVNAEIARINGAFNITKGVMGRRLDTENAV